MFAQNCRRIQTVAQLLEQLSKPLGRPTLLEKA
jgi:hypothetical protein